MAKNTRVDSAFRAPQTTIKLRERKRKQPTEATDEAENTSPKRARARAGRRPRAQYNRDNEAANDVNIDLLAKLRRGDNMGNIVNRWISEYDENPDEAIAKLLQFFISATSCTGRITAVQIRSVDFKDIIESLSTSFPEECRDYPLVQSGVQWRKFRILFADFIMVFVSKIKNEIIFHENFGDAVLKLLIGFAEHPIRAFRHTATLAAMKFSSALVDVVVELVAIKEKNNRQIEAEKAKVGQQGDSRRLEQLYTTKQNLERQLEELCSMIQLVFKSVFTHRYRDIVPEIRCICITEIGNWMRAYPVLFLEDSYLKYIGWTLYDKVSDVRLKCIQALLPLYEREELIPQLELFTSKFKTRFVHMVCDKEQEVATKTCQLMTHIHRAFPLLLQTSDCVTVYETVYCANRALAMSAGAFLNARIFHDTDAQGNDISVRERLQALVVFFIEGQVHTHPAYLVDALIDSNPILKEWSSMASMLLDDQAVETDGELIQIMVCAAKQATTGQSPVGRTGVKKNAAVKDAHLLDEQRNKLTEALIDALPRLINKYSHAADKVASLVQLPLWFNFDIYVAGHHKRELDELMEALQRVFKQLADEDVLKNTVKTLQHLTTTSVAQLTLVHRNTLLDQISSQFCRVKREAISGIKEEQLDEEDQAKVVLGFRKMSVLLSTFEMRNVDVWDTVIEVLAHRHLFISSDIVDKGIAILFYVLSHDVAKMGESLEPRATLETIRKRRDDFFKCAFNIIESSVVGVEQALYCISDMLVLCYHKPRADTPLADRIIYRLNDDKVRIINQFVVNNVLDVSEEEFQRLDQQSQFELTCKRRVVLGQYSKLILFKLLPIKTLIPILRFYAQCYNDYGDILKEVLIRCREIDRIALADAFVTTLITVFDDTRIAFAPNDTINPADDTFALVRDLAKRFAAIFTGDEIKNREAVAHIHHIGIKHALSLDTSSQTNRERGARRVVKLESALKTIAFLELLREFSGKLINQDKAAVLKYLEDNSHDVPDPDEHEQWSSYVAYKASLTTTRRQT